MVVVSSKLHTFISQLMFEQKQCLNDRDRGCCLSQCFYLHLVITIHSLIYYYKMIEPYTFRLDGELKKAYYRRLALIRKTKWANALQQHPDEHLKSHFMRQQENEVNEEKTKKIAKVEYKPQQRIRNRMAAQESRERHRCYVQELERKVKVYEQLIQKQGQLCKNCRKNLNSELTETDDHFVTPSERKEESLEEIKQDPKLQLYLNEQIIRIDNEGATTPFGIFFLVCIVAILAVFAMQNSTPIPNYRVLANYQALPDELDYNQEIKQESAPNFANFVKSKGRGATQLCVETEKSPTPLKKNLRSYTPSMAQGWTKMGEYICSSPSVVMNECEGKKAQFLLVRTERNLTRSLSDESEQSYRIFSKGWERIQISQCFFLST